MSTLSLREWQVGIKSLVAKRYHLLRQKRPKHREHNVPTRMPVTIKSKRTGVMEKSNKSLSDPNDTEMCTVRAVTELSTEQRCSNSLPIYRSASTETRIGNNLSHLISYIWIPSTDSKESSPTHVTESERKRYGSLSPSHSSSTHSYEHWCDGEYIKIQLRRRGDSYRVYLRSTQAIQARTTALDNLLPYQSNFEKPRSKCLLFSWADKPWRNVTVPFIE